MWLGVLAGVGYLASVHRKDLAVAGALLLGADRRWLLPAGLAIVGVYLCRSTVYSIPLRLLGYAFNRRMLLGIALVATTIHQLAPAGGATGYVFLTWAFARQGVSAGRASLVAMIDTLSYAVAVASLVVLSLLYLVTSAHARWLGLAGGLVPGLGLAGVAVWIYWLQRNQRRFTALVLRLKDRLAGWLGRPRWPDAPIRAFLDQYYEAKTVIARRRRAFVWMVGWQYLSVICDVTAVYMAFLALGLHPPPGVVVMGFVLAMSGLALMAVPAGGGSFEAIMAAFYSSQGIEPAQSIAAAILYRVVAFWGPVLVTAAIVLWIARSRRRGIRRLSSRRSDGRATRPRGANGTR